MSEDSDDERARIRDFYDKEYYTDNRDHDSLPWHYRSIAKRLGIQNGKRALDIACGTGKWLELLARRGAATSGIDISERAVEVCRLRLPECDARVGPAEDLPFPDSSFDLITCMGSLEHFLEAEKALAEMRRVARKNAQFLFLVPISGFLPRRLGLFGGTDQASVREIVRSLDGWERLFTSAGLTVTAQWRDLHVLSFEWIARNGWRKFPMRFLQALMLPVWPISWQYQVYFYCRNAS